MHLEAEAIGTHLARGLEYLHSVDYVHADVKPLNAILCTPELFDGRRTVRFGERHIRTADEFEPGQLKQARSHACNIDRMRSEPTHAPQIDFGLSRDLTGVMGKAGDIKAADGNLRPAYLDQWALARSTFCSGTPRYLTPEAYFGCRAVLLRVWSKQSDENMAIFEDKKLYDQNDAPNSVWDKGTREWYDKIRGGISYKEWRAIARAADMWAVGVAMLDVYMGASGANLGAV